MQYGFQPAFLCRVAIDALSHGVAVKVAIRGEDICSESGNYFVKRRLARCNQFACELIGVDNGYAQRAERVGNSCFAAAYATGQADDKGAFFWRGWGGGGIAFCHAAIIADIAE